MNKIIFIFTLITLAIMNPLTNLNAQSDSKNNKDTLMIGGIYKVLLTDGRDYTGELTGKGDSNILLYSGNNLYRFEFNQIRVISIAARPYKEKKFQYLGSIQAGISVLSGEYADFHKDGFGMEISSYLLFNRYTGISTEIQFNNFQGTEVVNNGYNYYYTTKTNYFNLYSIKFNFIAGNLFPEDKIVYYGLAGIGYQFYSPQGNSDFTFGAGFGAFYKISRELGVSGEFQLNSLSNEYDYYSPSNENAFDGCYSLRFGIMYTVF